MWSEMKESTPCVKICIMHLPSGLCQGCGRTLDEIQRWPFLTEPDRLAVMAALPVRLAQSRAERIAAAGRTNRRRASDCRTAVGR